MSAADANNTSEGPGDDVTPASALQRKYIAPSLSRYGTLADLTQNSMTQFKNGNDGAVPAPGCGDNHFKTSCIPSDIRLKADITPLMQLDNGLGLYRYRYKWDHQLFVGVMAQEVAAIVPNAVLRGQDGYLQVDYAQLGLSHMTWDDWVAREGCEAQA